MRALYEWIVDNECTPYVLVDASIADVLVPRQFVKDNQIVLNISPDAVMDLSITNQAVAFNGRFGGVDARTSGNRKHTIRIRIQNCLFHSQYIVAGGVGPGGGSLPDN